ncbi:MAG: phage terminase large subunit family protein [Gammaproteobacteria bacterium]|nr:phage terminase large subunit family protein [Gammaproteobacteria bacterium]
MIKADGGHKWQVNDTNDNVRILTTLDMIHAKHEVFSIPITKPMLVLYREMNVKTDGEPRKIVDIVEVEPTPVQCIAIDSPDHLYLAGRELIPTHNTELMLNVAMYYIHQEPSPIMYIAPKQAMAEAWSKERLVKSINATPVLKGIFSDNRRGDQGNTILQKQFAGGQVSIVSARNADDLAMRAVRIMLFDECDKYPLNTGATEGGEGGEGDPIAIAWARSTTYGRRAKKIVACSPTVQGRSRIEQEYLNSDQRVFIQPCPHCKHEKELKWEDIQIPRDDKTGEFFPDHAKIVCSECGTAWLEKDRTWSIRNGFWKATKPNVTRHRGYKVSALASPFTEIVVLANEFAKAQGNPQALKTFYNTRLAETWREKGDQPDWKRMEENKQNYPIGKVPANGLMLTAGIDVQKDCLYYWVDAWSERRQTYTVDAGRIDGDITLDETKERLYHFLDKKYENHVGVMMPLEMVCIDSGYNSSEVYHCVREYGAHARFRAVKGMDSMKVVTGAPSKVDIKRNGKKRISRGLSLYPVGSSVAKEQLYRWFNLEPPTSEVISKGGQYPTGYCFIPEFPDEFFKQLCAEQLTKTTDKRGFDVYTWEKVRPDNHFLDCKVYSLAAAEMLEIDRMTEAHWDSRRKQFGYKSWKKEEKVVKSIDKVKKPRKKRKKSEFWG